MMFRRKNLILLGIIILAVWIIFSILSSSNISISRSNDNSKIVFGAEFPNAECKKTFKRDLPFFEFKCSQLTEQAENSETPDKKNTTKNKEKLDSTDKPD